MQTCNLLNENLAYSIIEDLIIKAQKAPAYSPDFDKIISKINNISLPKWRSNSYIAKIQSQNHAAELDHIIKTTSYQKQSILKQMFSRKNKNIEQIQLTKTLKLIHNYCDKAEISIQALKREANEIRNYIGYLKSAESFLIKFKNHLPSRLPEPKLSTLMFLIEEKKTEIIDMLLVYQNAMLAHNFAANCLDVGVSNAKRLGQALSLQIKVKEIQKQKTNKIHWKLEKSKPNQIVNKNKIIQSNSYEDMQKITEDVKSSNNKQKNAITEILKYQKIMN